ncbi:MAG: hypothetical protein Q8Q01_00675 [archaeon]|nr:hypothetical protein [archaeon]
MNTKQRIEHLLKKYEEPLITAILCPLERQLYIDDYSAATA